MLFRSGYEPTAGGTWRLFYADDCNAYLIRDSIGTQKLSDYCSSYTTISDLGKNLNREYTNKQTWNMSNANAKAVAYLTDTSVWNTNYKTNDASWAIGAPLLEMFIASYNATHTKQIQYQSTTNYPGYKLKVSTDNDFGTEIRSLGKTSDLDKAVYCGSENSYWLSSPNSYNNEHVGFVNTSYGALFANGGLYNNTYSLRPVVSIPITLIGSGITITDSYGIE